MLKLSVSFMILVISFAGLFLASNNIQMIAAITSMCVSGAFMLHTAVQQEQKRLAAGDLYDYSAE
jgi:hypothetical protein